MEQTYGNYRLTRPLGEGGMGVVYEAQHLTMGRPAAVKVLRPELARDEEAIHRLFNEARATNEIRHPGIVQIYDCGKTRDGAPWLIMELLTGETLSARLGRLHRLSPEAAVDLGVQTASALGAAHAAGIIHRDLKPDNLFLVPDPDIVSGERVKVLDFGIAKLNVSTEKARALRTRTGMLMGTPLYMSPEQCRGNKEIDGRSDVYSLGLILYQMLAGEPPFISDGLGELFDMHMNRSAAPLEHRNAAVGPALAKVIEKALQKSPAERFQSMADLQKALAAWSVSGAVTPPRLAAGAGPEAPSGTRAFPSQATTLSASAMSLASAGSRRGRARKRLATLGGLMVVAGVAAVLVFRAARPSAPPTVLPVAHGETVPPPPRARLAAEAPPPTVSHPDQPAPAVSTSPAGDMVAVKINTVPSEARVVDAKTNQLLGMTPMAKSIASSPGGRKIRLEKPGYSEKSVVVPPGRDFTRSFKLDKASAGGPAMGQERIIKL